MDLMIAFSAGVLFPFLIFWGVWRMMKKAERPMPQSDQEVVRRIARSAAERQKAVR